MVTKTRSHDQIKGLLRTASDGGHVEVWHYFGSRPYSETHSDANDPDAFLIRVAPGRKIAAHFHPIDQFQVFLGTTGAQYQRTSLEHTTVHYADRHTVYGPFRASPDGEPLRWFTLRPRQGAFTGYMPADRGKLQRSQPTRTLHRAIDDVPLHEGSGLGLHSLFDPQPDGMAAFVIRLGQGRVRTPEIPQSGPNCGGEFYCAMSGSWDLEGQHLGPLSLGWWDGLGGRPRLKRTGYDPAEIIVMRLPERR